MSIRQSTTKTITTNTIYDKVLKQRGVKSLSILIYNYFNKVYVNQFSRFKYVWKKNDNLFKLSNTFYKSKDYWWVIAYCNRKPTDAHFEIGEVIYIPTNAEEVVRALQNVS